MQVNYSTSPNFKALKIVKNNETVNALKKLSPNQLLDIKKVGEKLKDTKFFDVLIDGYGNDPIIRHGIFIKANRPSPNLREYKDDKNSLRKSGKELNLYFLNEKYAITAYGNTAPLVVEQFNLNKKVVTAIPRCDINALDEIADVAITLDEISCKIEQDDRIHAEQEEIKRKEVENLTNDLLNSFGA